MRGTLVGEHIAVDVAGIIPADAGNTYLAVKPDITPGDHPRGCGEHLGVSGISAIR